MATSTFFDKITIDQRAAEILAKGLKGPRPSWPTAKEARDMIEEGEEALRQLRIRLETQSAK